MKKNNIVFVLWFGLFYLLFSGIIGAISGNINDQYFASPSGASLFSLVSTALVIVPTIISSYAINKYINGLRDEKGILAGKYRVLFIVIFVLLLSISSILKAGLNQFVSQKESKYISGSSIVFKKDVFSFKYPSSWVKVPTEIIAGWKKGRETSGAKVLFADGVSDYDGETLTTWLIVGRIENKLLPGGLSNSFFEGIKKSQEEGFSVQGLEIISITKTRLAGIPAILTKMKNEDVYADTYMVYPSEPGVSYSVSFNTMYPNDEETKTVFRDIISSFKISER